MFHDDLAKVALPSVRGITQCIEGLAYIATISHPSGRSMFAFQSTAALGVAHISEDGSLDSSNAVQEGLGTRNVNVYLCAHMATECLLTSRVC